MYVYACVKGWVYTNMYNKLSCFPLHKNIKCISLPTYITSFRVNTIKIRTYVFMCVHLSKYVTVYNFSVYDDFINKADCYFSDNRT